MLTSGAGSTARNVKRQSIHDMIPIASANVRTVSVQYITPGPSIMRTAFRSLVARAIRSPVRFLAKYPGESDVR